MREMPWRVMIARRLRTFIVYDVKMTMNSKFVIIRTLFYFAFNMMNALCMLCCLFDADNLCDSGALVVWYNCEWMFDVYNVWRMRFFIEDIRPRPLTCGKGGELKRINIKLRVFDPGRLLVVSVGNLNELTLS